MSLLLLALTLSALVSAATLRLGEETTNVLWLVGGMLTAGFFHSLAPGNDRARSVPSELSFNPELSRRALEKVIDAEFVDVTPTQPPSWDLTSQELLRRDPQLALARLRIELERQLRRLTSHVDPSRKMRLSQMISQLLQREVIPPELASAMRDIIPAANNAVHGNDIPTEQAYSLVELGDEVLSLLQNIHEDRVSADPQTNEL